MRAAMYIGWAIFVVVVAISIVTAIRRTRRQEQLVADWPKVAATVTGHRQGWSSGAGGLEKRIRFFPAYRFTDAQGRVFHGQSEIPQREVPVPGSTLEVAYNPIDPSQSFHQSAKTRQAVGCAIPFMIAMAVAFYFFIGIFPE